METEMENGELATRMQALDAMNCKSATHAQNKTPCTSCIYVYNGISSNISVLLMVGSSYHRSELDLILIFRGETAPFFSLCPSSLISSHAISSES